MKSSAGGLSASAKVGLLYFVIAAGLIVGTVAFGRFFLAEHQRLSFWDGVWFWFADAAALFWATVYFVRHTLLGVPLVEPPGSVRRVGLFWFLALTSILAGLGTDLWKTVSLWQAEREAFSTARRTEGTIDAAKTFRLEQANRVIYSLQCRYTDTNRVEHTAVFHVRDPDELPNLAPGVVRAVRAEQFPVPVTMAYDEDRPARCWLADLGGRDNRMYGFSILVLVFQSMTAVTFLVALAAGRGPNGGLPWWHDLHAVVLVAVEAGVLLLCGGLQLAYGHPVLWGDWSDV